MSDDEILLTQPGPRSDDEPAFQVRRRGGDVGIGDGDVNRGSLYVPPHGAAAAAIRYYVAIPEGLDVVGALNTRPISYDTMEIQWGIPAEINDVWSEMTIIRSAFGYPTTPAEGVMVMHRWNRSALDFLNEPPAPDSPDYNPETVLTSQTAGITYDKVLQSGRFYYYTFFFKVGVNWVVAKRHQNLIPFDYRHRDSMEKETAPFYFRYENEMNADFLRRWYWTIGFEADYTRTLAAGVEQIYNADTAPLSLLKELGKQNFGFDFAHWRRTVGEIRYRALIAKVRSVLDSRGTMNGLKQICEAASGYESFVLPGVNLMSLSDDAEFHNGIGNWAPSSFVLNRMALHLLTQPPLGKDPADVPDEVPNTRHLLLENFALDPEATPPNTPARGYMKATADDENLMILSCGVGQTKFTLGPKTKEIMMDPALRGIPVYEGNPYYLSFWMRRDKAVADPDDDVLFGFAYFTSDPATFGYDDAYGGQPPREGLGWMAGYDSFINQFLVTMDIVEDIRSNMAALNDQWVQYDSEFKVPIDGNHPIRFAVPFVWVHDGNYGPPEHARYFTGFMVNSAQVGEDIAIYRPQGHLRLTLDNPDDHLMTDGQGPPGETVRRIGSDYGKTL